MLEGRQLEPKLLIPDYYKETFAQIIYESSENKEIKIKFLRNLMKLLKEQEEIWDVARTEIKQFFEEAVTDGNLPEMRKILAGLQKKNQEIEETNKSMGIVRSY